MDSNTNNNEEPLRPPPETPRIMRVFRDQLSQSAPGSPSIFSLDPDLVTEVEKQYFSQSEELRLLKEKHEQLQENFDKLKDEKRALELQLLSEKNQKEEAVRNAGVKIEHLMIEHRAHTKKMQSDMEQWKVTAELGIKEVELLQEQLILVTEQKVESSKKVIELETRLTADEKHPKNTEVYLRRQREVFEETKKKQEKIHEAGKKLHDICQAQKAQNQKLNFICQALDKQKVADDARIHELEQQLIAYKTANVQLEQKVQLLQVREESKEKLMEQLVTEKKEISNEMHELIQALATEMDCRSANIVEVCEQLQNNVTTAASSELITDEP